MMTEEQKKMVEQNLKLVHTIVSKNIGSVKFLEYGDLYQAGCEGLIYAVCHYDPNQPCQFSSYAYPCIDGYIKREIGIRDNIIKIPNKLYVDMQRWKRQNHEKTLEDFSQEYGHRKDLSLAAFNAMMPVVYLDAPIMCGEEWESLHEFIQDESVDIEKEVAFRGMSNQIHTLLKTLEDTNSLSKKQIEILKRRCGFYGNPQTLQEIAIDFNITRERVRQLEAKALRKLRHYEYAKSLEPCIELCNEHDFSEYA